MYHSGNFLGKTLLDRTKTGILGLLSHESIDFLLVESGENLDVTLSIVVAHIEPELIERVRTGAVAVEPDIAFFGFSEFLAVGFSDKRASECKSIVLCAKLAADKFGSGGDVAPLVATAHLQLAVLGLVEVEEVVALEKLIGKLGKRHTLLELAIEATLHAILSHHIIHGDALSYFAGEVEE